MKERVRRLARGLDRALRRVYLACGYAAALFLALIGVLVLASIITRQTGTYVAGLTAYSGYCMAAASFLALAYTFREGGHIRVAVFLNRLRGRGRWLAELWCLGVATALSAYLAYYLAKMVWISYRFQERSEGADAMLLWIPQSALAVGAAVLAVSVLHSFVRALWLGEVETQTDLAR